MIEMLVVFLLIVTYIYKNLLKLIIKKRIFFSKHAALIGRDHILDVDVCIFSTMLLK